MAQYKLENLYNRFCSKSNVLLTLFYEEQKTINQHPESKNIQAMCIIKLYSLWEWFSKELIIISASYQPISKTGLIIKRLPQIKNRYDVLNELETQAKQNFLKMHPTKKFKWREPKWYNPRETIKAATNLNIDNLSIIVSALSLTPAPHEDIRIIRNYFAHYNEDTAKKIQTVLRRLHLANTFTAYDIINARSTASVSAVCIFENWINTLKIMADNAIQ